MRLARLALPVLVFAAASAFTSDLGGSLSGSLASVRKQHRMAKKAEYKFLRTAAQVREWVRKERLVTLATTESYVVEDVSFPYARPAVKLFIERLSTQYRVVTGERLVITSLTRPVNHQPENASALSVHPAGMAVDLRVPANARDRKWLERALLSLEDRTVLDVTRERNPPHYHVAVYPEQYERYVAKMARSSAN